MKLVYRGKTKDVYELPDGDYLLKFKDDVTGTDGVFDPGSNHVALSIDGMGRGGLRMSEFFFKKIDAAGVPTHFVSADIGAAQMTVRPATQFGLGLEVICRFRAVGSFLRRYGQYVKEGQALDALVEMTLKADDREDPPATRETLEMLGVLASGEYDTLVGLTKRIAGIVGETIAAKSAELYDIKFEFGRLKDGTVALIDEISAGNMRVYKDSAVMPPLDLVKLLLD